MNTHAAVVHEQASEQASRDDRYSAPPDRLTWAELLGATVPLISAPAYFGPPVIFLLGPWLILVLLLIPPAAVLITLVLVVLLAATLLVAFGALIASPYLLVRHLRARHRIPVPAPALGQEPFKQSVRPRLIHLTTR
jgi:hypothetical protein